MRLSIPRVLYQNQFCYSLFDLILVKQNKTQTPLYIVFKDMVTKLWNPTTSQAWNGKKVYLWNGLFLCALQWFIIQIKSRFWKSRDHHGVLIIELFVGSVRPQTWTCCNWDSGSGGRRCGLCLCGHSTAMSHHQPVEPQVENLHNSNKICKHKGNYFSKTFQNTILCKMNVEWMN